MNVPGTYVYCLVAADRPPALRRRPKGLAGAGPLRLLPVGDVRRREAAGVRPRRSRLDQWLVVADAPLDLYGEDAINNKLNDLDWVSRAAVAHEAVVESFIDAAALLPMKLFTIFTSDERAIEHLSSHRTRIDATLKRVTNQIEWGVRVVIDRAKAAKAKPASRTPSGAAYLQGKKSQRDALTELATRARGIVADVYDELAAQAADATKRPAAELPVKGAPLLLDAAFLVPRTRSARFRAAVARRARVLEPHGYTVSLTGPWPPYNFMRE